MKTQYSTFLRALALLLTFLMLASFALVSCNGNDQPENPENGQGSPENPENPENPEDPEDPAPQYEVITIAEALELCGAPGNVTTDRYYIRGTIDSVLNSEFGEMMISDETGSIYVYGTYSADGELRYYELDYMPVKGDEVLLHCILKNYNGNKEVTNARLIEYKNNQGNIDVSEYADVSISEAREAELGAKLKVDGVVARITYANGMVPNGVILVDETSSIYVYDGDVAQRVEIGNKVVIAGVKDFWILEAEKEGAAQFGYKGSNQLSNAILVSNDESTANVFDTSWITETTVKDIVETPVSENITSLVYKVTALVKKVPGTGFTNYYFFDIDGETGAYTYTQCNGSDFAWLDEFDGKICTVYLTALNAKSSSSSCFFRLLPISVAYEGYTFDLSKTPDYVLKYHVLDQFKSEYAANPEFELVTSVSSDLLGFSSATVSYSSDNTASVAFTEHDGKVILECLDPGRATVTVTATYNGASVSKTVVVNVLNPIVLDASDVNTAIQTEVGSDVVVKGIVGPSLVNRNGFYLIDETGIIAVVVSDTAIFADLEIGYEIVVSGMRDKFHNGKGTHAGQIAITNATVEANYYGNHEYDTSHFITGTTVSDFYALDVDVDYSTNVFIVTGQVQFVKDQYSTKVLFTDGNKSITLYCSGESQYLFLKEFVGRDITIELAACNWNNKTYYAGCVLAVITEDGKICNNLNFQ